MVIAARYSARSTKERANVFWCHGSSYIEAQSSRAPVSSRLIDLSFWNYIHPVALKLWAYSVASQGWYRWQEKPSNMWMARPQTCRVEFSKHYGTLLISFIIPFLYFRCNNLIELNIFLTLFIGRHSCLCCGPNFLLASSPNLIFKAPHWPLVLEPCTLPCINLSRNAAERCAESY